MSTGVIYSLEIIIFSFVLILLGCLCGAAWRPPPRKKRRSSKKKQLKVINYEIMPWQCDVRRQLHKTIVIIFRLHKSSCASLLGSGHVMGF